MAQQAKRIEEGKPSYSGRLLLRMPPELHAEVARKAELEQTSLNQFITAAVADAVDGAASENGAHAQPALASPRAITAALVVNFVVLTVAAATAVILLVLIWRGSV